STARSSISTLSLHDALPILREEIEKMEAERKSLMYRIDFATLNLTIREDYQAQLQISPDSTRTRIRNAAVEGYKSMVNGMIDSRSEEHTSELQSPYDLVCRR